MLELFYKACLRKNFFSNEIYPDKCILLPNIDLLFYLLPLVFILILIILLIHYNFV